MKLKLQPLIPSVAILLLTAFGLSGCQQGPGNATVSEKMSDSATQSTAKASARVASAPMNADAAVQSVVRQVDRRADLGVRVENVEKAEKEVGRIVNGLSGYVESASSTDLAASQPILTISVRVPVGQFETTIAKFEALGTRLSKKISATDVTGQIVDLDARLKTLYAQEDVYRELLKRRGKLDEVLSIQQQLSSVRTEIESISGQRKAQARLAALSTISLTLEQGAVVVPPPTNPNWLAQTWSEASTGAKSSFQAIASVAIWILVYTPFWMPVLFLTWLAWVVFRRRWMERQPV